jgi:hypothetical protein
VDFAKYSSSTGTQRRFLDDVARFTKELDFEINMQWQNMFWDGLGLWEFTMDDVRCARAAEAARHNRRRPMA